MMSISVQLSANSILQQNLLESNKANDNCTDTEFLSILTQSLKSLKKSSKNESEKPEETKKNKDSCEIADVDETDNACFTGAQICVNSLFLPVFDEEQTSITLENDELTTVKVRAKATKTDYPLQTEEGLIQDKDAVKLLDFGGKLITVSENGRELKAPDITEEQIMEAEFLQNPLLSHHSESSITFDDESSITFDDESQKFNLQVTKDYGAYSDGKKIFQNVTQDFTESSSVSKSGIETRTGSAYGIGHKRDFDRINIDNASNTIDTAKLQHPNIEAVGTEGIAKHSIFSEKSSIDIQEKFDLDAEKTDDDEQIAYMRFNPAGDIKLKSNTREISFENIQSQASETGKSEMPVYMQVSEKITGALKEKQMSLKIKLRPEGLGELTVDMSYENGGISLNIQSNIESTQIILNDQIDRLKTALSQADFNVTGINIEVGSENLNFNQQLSYSHEFHEKSNGQNRALRHTSHSDFAKSAESAIFMAPMLYRGALNYKI